MEDIKDNLQATLEKLEATKDYLAEVKRDESKKDWLQRKLAEELTTEETRLKMRSKFDKKKVVEKGKQEQDSTLKSKLQKVKSNKFNGIYLN